jgi:hypothetical protein
MFLHNPERRSRKGQKNALRARKANRQSTIIVLKGDKEVGRSVGVTDPDETALVTASPEWLTQLTTRF